MNVIKLDSKIKPSALLIAMGYRGVSRTELCKNIKGLYVEDLSRFLQGYHAIIQEDKLKEIMMFLEFPYSFLTIEVKEVNILG